MSWWKKPEIEEAEPRDEAIGGELTVSDDLGQLLLAGGEAADRRADDFFGQGQVQVADRAGDPRVAARFHLARVAGGDHGQAGVLVRVGLGVLVDEQGTGVVEQRAARLPGIDLSLARR